MARRKRSNGNPNKLSLTCDTVKFYVQDDRNEAVAVINYSRHVPDSEGREFEIQVPVISLWMDPENGNCVKAHLFRRKNVLQHQSLIDDLKLAHNGRMMADYGAFCFVTDGKFLRYGKPPNDHYSSSNYEGRHNYVYYNSKAEALADILKHINRHQTIGGLNLVSLNRLPNELLLEMGFEEVPDLLKRRGISMWKGNPLHALGSDSYGEEGVRARRQFLDLMGQALNIPENG